MQVSADPTLAPVIMFWGCCAVFLIGYAARRMTTEGRQRLVDCYLVMATGNITELLLAFVLSTFTGVEPGMGTLPPTHFLSTFSGYIFFMILWSIIPWSDLVLQWTGLRRSEID